MAVLPRVSGPSPTVSEVVLALRQTHPSLGGITTVDVLRIVRELDLHICNGRLRSADLPTIHLWLEASA